MPERNNYRILDIGTGYGGYYIKQFSSSDRPIFSIDKSFSATQILHLDYQNIFPLCGDAKDLPFEKESFSNISIHFPHGTLLQPGLQDGGWYDEYARILKPNGKLIIYGDDYLNVKEVLTSSEPLFNIKECRSVNMSELNEIGTDIAQEILLSSPINQETKVFPTVYKIVLEKK